VSAKDFPQQFKDMGREQVKLLMATNIIPPQFHRDAADWLKETGQEERSRKERESASDRATALSAKRAAWIAAIAAIIAAIAAIIDIALEFAKK
jgi:hypothetical protein